MRFLFIALLLVNAVLAHSSDIRLSGFVKDSVTNEVLTGANIFETDQLTGTTTDNKGFFSLNISNAASLSFSFTGYQSKTVQLNSNSDTFLVVFLIPGKELSEISVNANRNLRANITHLSAYDFKRIPVLGAKPDIIKTLQLLPGVQAQSEGMSLFYVRGGEPGQNQYLLDDVPLIYVNHFGGLTSVFNPEMINSVDFYKGSFPARHGGKLSSIVDITQKEGNLSTFVGSYSIGLTDASFSLEGPLIRDKLSFIITARKTLIDFLLAGISTVDDVNNSIISYGFHDVNAKLSWKHDERNTFNFNLYQGDDYFNFWGKPWELEKNESNHISQVWGNWLLSGNWKKIIGDHLFVENLLSYTKYRNKSKQTYKSMFDAVEEVSVFKNTSSVNNLSAKSIWKYAMTRYMFLEFGNETNYMQYEPGYYYNSTAQYQVTSSVYHTFKTTVFIDNIIDVSPSVEIRPSLRFNLYINNSILYPDVEPRVNFRFKVADSQNLELNYMRVMQYDHLMHIQDQIIKSEIWLPASSENPPQLSDQLSVSWMSSIAKDILKLEVSLYYKKMDNLARLKMGYENALGLTDIEHKLLRNGKGAAYGSEIILSKNKGILTGSVAYSFTESKRSFAEINKGEFYDYEYNSPHTLTLNANRKLNRHWNFNLVWTFSSGLPYTPASGKHLLMDLTNGKVTDGVAIDYEEYNSGRMQNYHRMDVGFTYETKTKKGNKAVWTFSVYNLYNRMNPYNYYYDDDKYLDTGVEYTKPLKLYKVTWFPIIPSFSYKVFFDDIKFRN
ncbi:carboxypeptidase-like regulatory domain-containing protein [Saccharicrinis sp. FJH2]|uniref:TonB-dependent receptor n=1 Tax=Saccharicrinis sp. FJH65 TaxID=3344659 RepID=UPI0035F339E6